MCNPIKVFTIARVALTFYFKKKSHSSCTFRKLRRNLFFSTLMSLCTVISANTVNLYSSVLLGKYVFSLFRVETLLSMAAVVTRSTIQVKLKDILRGAWPTCAPLLPTPLFTQV